MNKSMAADEVRRTFVLLTAGARVSGEGCTQHDEPVTTFGLARERRGGSVGMSGGVLTLLSYARSPSALL